MRSRSGAVRAALAVLVMAGCGGASEAPDFVVRGAGVVVRSGAVFTQSSDFPQRVESTVGAALAYWGGDWSALEGRLITFDGAPYVTCGAQGNSVGCYDGNIRLSTLDAGQPLRCVEETVLVHEIGHAVIGDADHADPRWMDFTSVMEALRGRPGYAEGGAAPCELAVSVWRHPPRD
jgi:hypothetical protein